MEKILEEQLETLANNKLLLQAIGTVFNESIRVFEPDVTEQDNNQVIGEKYRAYKKAEQILLDAIKTIDGYKVERDNPTNFNKAK